MRTIDLTQGEYTMVDITDYDWLMQWKWQCNNYGYAVTTVQVNNKKKTILMHREILGVSKGVGLTLNGRFR